MFGVELRRRRSSRRCDPIAIPGLSKIPWIGPILFDHDILVYVGLRARRASVWFVLFRTRVGLTVRATGERPEVVAAAGGRPKLVADPRRHHRRRARPALGGAQLSVGYVGNWFNNMTSGYGFVAVAVVLFAAWRPVRVLAGAYPVRRRARRAPRCCRPTASAVNQYLLDALPYLVTLLALVLFARGGSSQAPEGLRRALTNTS